MVNYITYGIEWEGADLETTHELLYMLGKTLRFRAPADYPMPEPLKPHLVVLDRDDAKDRH